RADRVEAGSIGRIAGRRRRDQSDGDDGRGADAAGCARPERRDAGLKRVSRYYGGWAPYVPVAERRRKAQRTMAKLQKASHPVAPVIISGRLIATTFWGRAWCDNLESYRDYDNRLPRGRTYVRNGSVVDLQIAPGRIAAKVSGSELYDVAITIQETAKTRWRAICADCAGGIDSLVELLQGRFSKGVMERLCRQEGGLFPRPSDIRFTCSCPDHASMCKHVAAVLYGVGARLDRQPELLFRLRAVDEAELVAGLDTALPLSKTGPAAGKVLDTDDMSALFGLDLAAAEVPAAGKPSDGSSAARARRAGGGNASDCNQEDSDQACCFAAGAGGHRGSPNQITCSEGGHDRKGGIEAGCYEQDCRSRRRRSSSSRSCQDPRIGRYAPPGEGGSRCSPRGRGDPCARTWEAARFQPQDGDSSRTETKAGEMVVIDADRPHLQTSWRQLTHNTR